ncbi:hypothetical protein NQ314_017976 [Rhamnusium bicolor]|uniref:Uncharacterized protein n=1 Tax=Rhamnusium bicolor TaxID=1586634 RepID=A0AAV8WS16_9CUCU|nr:hypothetical protein NQ314_017976 [Rhamnusium bicolor]
MQFLSVSLDKSKVSCSLLSFENNEKLFEFDEQNKHFNDIVERYLDEINELKVKNEDIQTKLDIVNGDNEVLCLEVTTMKEKIVILEQDLSNILTEKKMKEENLEQIQLEKNKVENELKEFKKINSELKDENNNLLENNKSINNTLKLKDTILTELEEKLLSLKREFTNLHMENISKEKELFEFRNKFNFETAYKNIQIELNEKNKDLLEIAKSNEELKELLGKITNSNQELQKSLKQAKLDLKENQDKSKEMLMLNENIEQTASQVQVHIDRKNVMINELVELNRKFESNIGKLQEQLQDKIKEVTELRDCLKSDMEIKNMMWRDNKELKLKLDNEHKTNEKLSEELQEIQNKIKEEKEEYSSLRFKYDQEADRNCELCAEILAQKEELSLTFDKYNKEISENRKLYEKVSTLRNEIDVIKESQKECKMQINNKLSSYDDLIKKLEVKLQELRVQNDTLKIELESEKNKPKKDRFFDAVVTSSEIGKNRSFEKQTMKIDRLKEKLDITEQQLQNEKIKNDQLGKIIQENDEVKEKYAKIQVDFAQAESKNNVEKQELKHKIKDLSEKLRYQSENYIKLENIVNEKETVLSLKLSQIEQQNQHLYAELTNKDCIINNIYAEMETYKNANKIAQELSTKLSAKLFELNEKEKEIHYINAQVAEKNNNILSLTSKIRDQEIQLTKALDELTENKNINFNLEEENRKLQEMLSISDNLKEKDLTETEQKLKSTCRLLQCSEMELSLIEKKLTDAKMEFDCISTEISEHKDMICHGNFELSR